MHAFTQRTSELVGRIAQRQRETAGELRRLRSDHDLLRNEFDAMVTADKIADAVLAGQKKARREWWSVSRIIAGGLVAAVVAVPAVHDLVSWLR